jgi:hypothetical protein
MADDISPTSSGNQTFDFSFVDSEPELADEEEEQVEDVQVLFPHSTKTNAEQSFKRSQS